MPEIPPDARILILLNPGRQSRHYLLGLAAAAGRIGVPCASLELGPIWQATAGAGGRETLASARKQIAALVRAHRITHALAYVFNGTHDLGMGADGRTLWDELGVRHILLWTDHPEWAMQGCALDEPLRGLLGGGLRSHLLKSGSAAEEAGAVLGWPSVRACAMGEDYASLTPAHRIEAVHDAVAIVGDAAAPPEPTLRFLAEDDPEPGEIDGAMRPAAERAWDKVVGVDHQALRDAWLDLKRGRPMDSFWRLSRDLPPEHGSSLAWLRAEPRRWYGAVQALRRMTGWRRNFWLAWLGRRANLGLYGSSAGAMGIAQSPDQAAWVPYERQAEVYARGRIALNINAAHDEEGLTHKPFQISAAGAACAHHDCRGLAECFTPGTEVLAFRRGAELLDAVRRAGADPALREALGSAMRRRAEREHSWERRLAEMLRMASAPGLARGESLSAAA